MALYPLKFEPLLKSKIWGGTKLGTFYGKVIEGHCHVGESWELSGFGNEQTVVTNGFLADNELGELVEVYMAELVGEKVYETYGDEFPLLFKLIDANDNLSVQVHPDDEVARELHNANGKSEMWYVLHAEPGAQIIAGLKHPMTPDQFKEELDKGNILQHLQTIPVKIGDVINIPPGLIHSLGKGVMVAEIQQASDITYRLYDYDRVDADGNRRELHIDNALRVIDFDNNHTPLINYTQKNNAAVNIVKNDFFTTNIICFDRTIQRDYSPLDSFVVYMCVAGVCTLRVEDYVMTLKAGETILLPATTEEVTLRPLVHEQIKILEIYI